MQIQRGRFMQWCGEELLDIRIRNLLRLGLKADKDVMKRNDIFTNVLPHYTSVSAHLSSLLFQDRLSAVVHPAVHLRR